MPSAASLLCSVGLVVTLATAHPVFSQQISFTRELLIDANEHDLSQVWFVAAFRDGTIVVSQPQDKRLVYFTPDGRRLANVGRAGSGPGEFGQVGVIPMFVGDSLLLSAGTDGRYLLFNSLGQLVRGFRLPVPAVSGHGELTGGYASIWGMDGNGNFLVRRSLYGSTPATWRRNIGPQAAGQTAVVHTSPNGTVQSLIAIEPSHTDLCTSQSSMQSECLTIQFRASDNARVYASVSATINDSRSAYITVTSTRSSGDTAFSRRIPFTPEPLGKRYIDSIVEMVRGNPRAVTYWSNAEYQKWLSPVKQILVASDDAVWVGFRPEASGRRWLILNADGTTRGTMTVPSSVYITAASATHFWGMLEDEDGLDHPVRYRLGSPGRQ